MWIKIYLAEKNTIQNHIKGIKTFLKSTYLPMPNKVKWQPMQPHTYITLIFSQGHFHSQWGQFEVAWEFLYATEILRDIFYKS